MSTRLPAGTVLYRAGDECRGFVTVHEGTIRVGLTAPNGREIVLYRVGPGQVCLQTFNCLVNGTRYSAEAVAEGEIAIEVTPPGAFQARLAEDAAFRDRLFASVAARFAELERLVEDVALVGIESRLARALLRLMGEDGVVTATHEALASEIGSVREVVSRHLSTLARDGLVELARGHLRVIAAERLAAL
ncbi:MAG: Crp/Fnr family transcriptional regulator [Sphingomonadales bacterium]|nr:Crp/Fnr family transcriptional regulator [Sphingomonadales bacterium]